MPFVPDVPPEAFPVELRYAVTSPDGETCRTANIFHKLVHSPAVFSALADVTAVTLSKLKLDPVLRELAICTATRLTGGAYPHDRHIQLALSIGVDQAKLLALPAYRGHPVFSEEEQAVIAFAEELTQRAEISPAVQERLGQFLDFQERVELAWTVSFYCAVARLTSACEVPVETTTPKGNALRR